MKHFIACQLGVLLPVALGADYRPTDARGSSFALPLEVDDLAALRVRAPAQLRITEYLLVAEEELVLLEGALLDEPLNPLLLEADVTVRAPQIHHSPRADLS